MTCESCVKDISTTLYKLEGISNVKCELKDQLVSIEGTGLYSHHYIAASACSCEIAAPSAIVTAIQDTGRDAILRGSGTSESKF